ncbi:MAG: CRISPR-associated endoribonuclease Cas6 [Desulfitobacteriaceae bacterium]
MKGYSGMMELSGPPPLLQVAIDAGLGSKNAQGCGCLEVMGGGVTIVRVSKQDLKSAKRK